MMMKPIVTFKMTTAAIISITMIMTAIVTDTMMMGAILTIHISMRAVCHSSDNQDDNDSYRYSQDDERTSFDNRYVDESYKSFKWTSWHDDGDSYRISFDVVENYRENQVDYCSYRNNQDKDEDVSNMGGELETCILRSNPPPGTKHLGHLLKTRRKSVMETETIEVVCFRNRVRVGTK